MAHFLFFYGVLRADVAEGAIRDLIAGIGPGTPASTAGDLYAVPDPLGWYPALVQGRGQVRGTLHEAGSIDLAALDRFEGVDPHDPMAGGYRREEVMVMADGGRRTLAHAYLWNRGITKELLPIAEGDFAAWLAGTGYRPFTG